MGFDLYGENPKVVIGFSDKKSERYEELASMSYSDREKQGFNDEYWELQSEWENNNPGNYFRNNVWWWRPLWSFTCDQCADFLTEDDMNAGCYNDNYIITEDKAVAIKLNNSRKEYAWLKPNPIETKQIVTISAAIVIVESPRGEQPAAATSVRTSSEEAY